MRALVYWLFITASACDLSGCRAWDEARERQKQAEEDAKHQKEQAALGLERARLKVAAIEASRELGATHPDPPESARVDDHDRVQRALEEAERAKAASSANGAATPSDGSIERLVTRLDKSPLWRNGHFPKIDLPSSATPEEVAARVFDASLFDRGTKVTSRHTVEARAVKVGDRSYTAMRVETDLGTKIVLMHYEGEKTGWWSRVFAPE